MRASFRNRDTESQKSTVQDNDKIERSLWRKRKTSCKPATPVLHKPWVFPLPHPVYKRNSLSFPQCDFPNLTRYIMVTCQNSSLPFYSQAAGMMPRISGSRPDSRSKIIVVPKHNAPIRTANQPIQTLKWIFIYPQLTLYLLHSSFFFTILSQIISKIYTGVYTFR